ncbi:MAG: alpha/beta hydrolase [Woeseiaceae bacterium]
MNSTHRQTTFIRRVAGFTRWLCTAALVATVAVYLAWAFSARNMLDLGPEHRIEFVNEFDASQETIVDWQGYMAIEDRLADELIETVDGRARPGSLVDRHDPRSWTHPGGLDKNRNRSYEMMATSPRGTAVLLHGLSDSPYSMLATAGTLVEAGFNVVVPRIPGHGFAVGGLRQARWEDWTATVRIAVTRAIQLDSGDSSLIFVGYSNGGLLALDYALRCEEYAQLPCPDKVVLISPAIAVSRAAIATNLHSLVSWTPFFEKFQWLSIRPEIDPFKFTSFPKRVAWEIYQVSTRMHKELADPAEAAKLPPILTFQSVVDNTVDTAAISRNLYRYLPANGSKLVVYDINRHNTIVAFGNNLPRDPTAFFASATALHYDVNILRNREPDTGAIDLVARDAGSSQWTTSPSAMQWPREMFSLSHIALPFRDDDAIYGNGTGPAVLPFAYGALAPRGEAGVLLLGSDYFLRTRFNPFYVYQADVIMEWLGKP